jgi:hypothetical protein
MGQGNFSPEASEMKVRYDFTGPTNLETALHDTLLEFNGDLADCVVAVAANADITFKPCQLSSQAQRSLDDNQADVEVDLAEFLRLLSGMVQMIDAHVTIRRSHGNREMILDLRVLDSSFAFLETNNEPILRGFDTRLTGARKSDA